MNGNFHDCRMIQRQEPLSLAQTYDDIWGQLVYTAWRDYHVTVDVAGMFYVFYPWFVTQSLAIICSATITPKLNCDS